MTDEDAPQTQGSNIRPVDSRDFANTGVNDVTSTAAINEKDGKFTGEILTLAGIQKLTAQSSIDEVEAALMRLRHEMSGVDHLRETAIRSEAIKHLQSIRQ